MNRTATDAQHDAYMFECDADLAQLAEAQRMRAAFTAGKADRYNPFCGYCLFMRDCSVHTVNGICPVCRT